MSAVAIVSVAAVCAGYLWFERRQVGRVARARARQRRHGGVLRWVDGATFASHDTLDLEQSIERTVERADIVWSYYDRLFSNGAPGESPFQLRRARVDAAQRRFASAAAHLEREAAKLLCETSCVELDAQSREAVLRMQRWLDEHPVPRTFPVGRSTDFVPACVDMLENVLANLRRRPGRIGRADPFRSVGPERSSRHRVTGRDAVVPSRQAASDGAAAFL